MDVGPYRPRGLNSCVGVAIDLEWLELVDDIALGHARHSPML